ncbi:3-isopropylmalate dehydrogenase [Trichinella spiralis]|uniref:3-isopropylmalate dehydrogenase n=1 Tax=Trichinella spiralis TaxID=6334 RepID=A0ABR3KLY0_TRISP
MEKESRSSSPSFKYPHSDSPSKHYRIYIIIRRRMRVRACIQSLLHSGTIHTGLQWRKTDSRHVSSRPFIFLDHLDERRRSSSTSCWWCSPPAEHPSTNYNTDDLCCC